ncbi:hypothetical protein [Laspinema palackyanum]|uniref:hypothetical protein n=1 Tax=Laspinema palackyanum TaxID=3231601 RepID=UPI00349F8844
MPPEPRCWIRLKKALKMGLYSLYHFTKEIYKLPRFELILGQSDKIILGDVIMTIATHKNLTFDQVLAQYPEDGGY